MKKYIFQFLYTLFLFILIINIYILEGFIKNYFLNHDHNNVYSQNSTRTFRPDYRDQDIKDFLKLMSALIGKNIITDDRVNGKITVVSPRRIPITEALKYLTAVLSIKGFGIVEEGEILKVVPLKDAVASSQIIIYSNTPWTEMTDEEIQSYSNISREIIKKEKIITQIIDLKNSKPNVISATLKQLTNPKTQIVTFAEGNIIIITGGPLEVNRLVKLVNYIDFDDRETIEEENISEDLSFGRFHVYRLENMESTDIVNTLNRLSIPENFGELYELQTDKITVQKTKVKELNQPQNKNNRKNNNRKKEEIKYKNLKLVAHKESNSILFIGTKKEFEQVRKLIKQLDLQKDQIFFEVLIAEISTGGGAQDGINPESLYSLLANLQDQEFTILTNRPIITNGGTTQGTTSERGSIIDFFANAGRINSQGAAAAGAVIGLTAFGQLVRFLRTSEDAKILSAPQILTVENQEATISSTEQVPIVNVTSTQQNTQSGVQYRDIGIKLKIKSRITRDANIHIELDQEVSNLISTTTISTAGVVAPTFRERKIKTTLRIRDNQTIAIGGLLTSEEVFTVSKIPLLGDIPLLGVLFKRKQKTTTQRNLFIFITPHIISNRKSADKLTKELIETYNQKLKEFESKNK